MMNEDTGALLNSIGGGILKRFIVTFDYEHQTMHLNPRVEPVPDTGNFDRAGTWINGSASGFEIVDVIKGSPAEQAGLKPGDTILAVNGKPASKIYLYSLREYFQRYRECLRRKSA